MIIALIIYMGDMGVIRDDPKERKTLQEYLAKELEMKDISPLRNFLGIDVSQFGKGIFLSQMEFALELLPETSIATC